MKRRDFLKTTGIITAGGFPFAAGLAEASTAPALLQAYVVSSVDGNTPSDYSKNVRIDQDVDLYCVVRASVDGREAFLGPGDVSEAYINGKKRPVVPASLLSNDISVSWSKVEPVMYHRDGKAPNPGIPCYSNSQLYRGNHGKWLGWDKIIYLETPVSRQLSIKADAHPTERHLDVKNGLGTMRYKVGVKLDGQSLESPGTESRNYLGISPDVHRISFRMDDSLVGYMTSYFNVPEVFGSDGPSNEMHQTELFTGTDCADIIVGAARLMGIEIPYTYVGGLRDYCDVVSEELIIDGNDVRSVRSGKKVSLKIGKDVQEGDIVPINYQEAQSGRVYEHVGVVFGRNPVKNGHIGNSDALDCSTLLGHLGHYELKVEAIRSQAPFTTQIWRLRK